MVRRYFGLAFAVTVLAVAGFGYLFWFWGVPNHETDDVDAGLVGIISTVIALILWVIALIDSLSRRSHSGDDRPPRS